ncbi:MAG: tetratricopeptide repeat protein [Gilvibacter sp.]
MKKLLFIALLSLPLVGMAQVTDLFNKGKELYKAESYEQAIEAWKTVIDKGQHSASLYYNIGNAYYKLNQVAPSIYYYEKALQLNPDDSEVLNNIAFARNMRVDIIEPLPKTVFAKWYQKIAGITDYDGWALGSVIFMILLVVAFTGYYFSGASLKKRFFFVGGLVMIALMLGSVAMAYSTYNDEQAKRFGIIFEEAIDVKSEPTPSGEFAFELHEGTKVSIVDQDQDWLLIRLIDGKEGWVPSEVLREL